jgi:c-di-GMP-binding flagellar brake protein YcgR
MNIEQQKTGGRSFGGPLDRRENSRFPVREDVRYRVLQSKAGQVSGAGKTVDISSGGILFTTSERLQPGRLIEISVNWPARLDGTCALQLVATGRVVRSDDETAAVRIERYEFKTRSSGALAAGAS